MKRKTVLKSVTLVPETDHWIYKDLEALKSLMQGLKNAEEGRIHDLGSFAKYAKNKD